MTAPSAPRTPGTSVRKTTRLAHSARARSPGEGIGVDVEDLAVRAEDDAGDDRDQAVVEERPQRGRVNALGLPYQPNIRLGLAAGAHQPAIHAADADGRNAGGVEEGHKLLVDGAGKHHDGQLQGFVVSDAQPVDERGQFVHAGQPVGERGAAAVRDHDL